MSLTRQRERACLAVLDDLVGSRAANADRCAGVSVYERRAVCVCLCNDVCACVCAHCARLCLLLSVLSFKYHPSSHVYRHSCRLKNIRPISAAPYPSVYERRAVCVCLCNDVCACVCALCTLVPLAFSTLLQVSPIITRL